MKSFTSLKFKNLTGDVWYSRFDPGVNVDQSYPREAKGIFA